MKIDKAKQETGAMTSEDLFGIPLPPNYQCDEITKMVKVIDECYSLSNRIDRLDEDDLKSNLNEINNELYRFSSRIEDIRTACENIRDWGNAWKSFAKMLIEKENINIENYI